MRYCVSDIHGEYELFIKLLEKIKFSNSDEMYIGGDIIDKGRSSVKLAKFIFSKPNMHAIMGNHEYDFLKLYHSLMESKDPDYDKILSRLQAYFPNDGYLLDFETMDRFDSLPFYIEKDDFIIVHSGIPMDRENRVIDPKDASEEELVYDRKFKNPNIIPITDKCIIFGHTATDNICGENKILAYKKAESKAIEKISDLAKIHIDTGSWQSGVLGCFCIDTSRVFYVKK